MEKIIDLVRQSAALLEGALASRSLSLSKRDDSLQSRLLSSSKRDDAASVAHLDDESLLLRLRAVEESGRFIDALRALSAAEVEDRSRKELGNDGLARRHGFARGTHLIEHVTRVSGAEAARRIRLGAAVRPRMGLGGALQPPRYAEVARVSPTGRSELILRTRSSGASIKPNDARNPTI